LAVFLAFAQRAFLGGTVWLAPWDPDPVPAFILVACKVWLCGMPTKLDLAIEIWRAPVPNLLDEPHPAPLYELLSRAIAELRLKDVAN
jgi:hypothetical protein